VGLILVCGIFFSNQVAFAESNGDLRKEINILKQRITELEKKLTKQEKEVTRQTELSEELAKAKPEDLAKIREVFKGLNIGVGATYIVQGAVDANNVNTATGSKKEEGVTDGSYSIDLGFEKTFDDWGMAFLHLETGDGAGVEDELEVFSNVNRDADDSGNSVSVTEAWYEHYLFGEQLTLTAGKIDPTGYVDQNEIANDETGS